MAFALYCEYLVDCTCAVSHRKYRTRYRFRCKGYRGSSTKSFIFTCNTSSVEYTYQDSNRRSLGIVYKSQRETSALRLSMNKTKIKVVHSAPDKTTPTVQYTCRHLFVNKLQQSLTMSLTNMVDRESSQDVRYGVHNERSVHNIAWNILTLLNR